MNVHNSDVEVLISAVLLIGMAAAAYGQVETDPLQCTDGWFHLRIPVATIPSTAAAVAEVEAWRRGHQDCSVHLMYYANRNPDFSILHGGTDYFNRLWARTFKPTDVEAIDVLGDPHGSVVRARRGEHFDIRVTGVDHSN